MSAIQVKEMAASIKSAISVSGLTVYDLSGIRTRITIGDGPILMPNPNGFVTNLNIIQDSLGAGSLGGERSTRYTLNYTLFYSAVSEGGLNFSVYNLMVAMAVDIIDAFVADDDIGAAIDIEPRIVRVGAVYDPTGNVFHGAEIALDILEFL